MTVSSFYQLKQNNNTCTNREEELLHRRVVDTNAVKKIQ